MRIYFIGSHASGKSTLCRYVSTKYNLPFITEVARKVLSEKELNVDTLRYDMEIVDDYQEQIFQRQIEEENKFDNFVSDRSFDCLAYAAQHSRNFSQLINSSNFINYIDKIKKSNSFIFFVRPSKSTLKQDGVRESLNWDGIIAIDAMVKMLLHMYDIKYFQINTDNMQERVNLIDAVLSLYVND